jgi:hypothetical protein
MRDYNGADASRHKLAYAVSPGDKTKYLDDRTSLRCDPMFFLLGGKRDNWRPK